MVEGLEGRPTDERLIEVFNNVEPYIEGRYGVRVVISDVVAPFTGDFDGAEIRVDHDVELADAVFIIVHLFGHTVQWCTSESARELASIPVVNPPEELLARLEVYEREACQYSIQLFHDAGVHDLDQWLSNFAACDLAYLKHFYVTGTKGDFMSFWRDGQELLSPLPIPEFHPTRWISRWEGVVI